MCNPDLLGYPAIDFLYRNLYQSYGVLLINASQEYKLLEKSKDFIKIIMVINSVVCDIILPPWHAMSLHYSFTESIQLSSWHYQNFKWLINNSF